MKQSWKLVEQIAEGSKVIVQRVEIPQKGLHLEGEFSLPPLMNLSEEEQYFVVAFLYCHGSIKEMERMFQISYPTVKNRLNKIIGKLDFVDIQKTSPSEAAAEEAGGAEARKPDKLDLLQQLEEGKLSVAELLKRL